LSVFFCFVFFFLNAGFNEKRLGGPTWAVALTTVCHAGRITRKDGAVFAFTDHDSAA